MTAGEIAVLVAVGVSSVLTAAMWFGLGRVRREIGVVRREIAELHGGSGPAELDSAIGTRHGLERFDPLASRRVITAPRSRSRRFGRAALAAPVVIKAAGIATGTSRAVRRLRGQS